METAYYKSIVPSVEMGARKETKGTKIEEGERSLNNSMLRNKIIRFLMAVGAIALPILGGASQCQKPEVPQKPASAPEIPGKSKMDVDQDQNIKIENLTQQQQQQIEELKKMKSDNNENTRRMLDLLETVQGEQGRILTEVETLKKDAIGEAINAGLTDPKDFQYIPYLRALLEVSTEYGSLGYRLEEHLPGDKSADEIRSEMLELIGTGEQISGLIEKFAVIVSKLPAKIQDKIIKKIAVETREFEKALKEYPKYRGHLDHHKECDFDWGNDKLVIVDDACGTCPDKAVHEQYENDVPDQNDELGHHDDKADTKSIHRLLRAAEQKGLNLDIFAKAIDKIREVFGIKDATTQSN